MATISFPKWIARYAAILWTIGIFFATLMPSSQVPNPGVEWPIDKVLHFAMFFGFGILWMRGLYARFPTRLLGVIAAGIVIAILTELLQGIMPYGRALDPADIIANIAGLLVGIMAFRHWFHNYRQPA